jgi:hypothetical protein
MKTAHSKIINPMKNPIIREKHRGIMKEVGKRNKSSGIFKGERNPSFGKVRYPSLNYVNELGHRVRSSWEKEVCLKLSREGIDYEYEPIRFKMSIEGKICSYTPDIRIRDIYVEVKGPLFDFQLKKMKLFIKEHKLILVTNKKNFKRLEGFDLIDYDKFIKEDFDVNDLQKSFVN